MHNAFILSLLLACPPQNSPANSAAPATHVFQKVAVVGASVSDGYQNNMPLGPLFAEAIRAPHEPVDSITSSLFFIDPVTEGARQLSLCAKRTPSMLLGLDFVFWYGYGSRGVRITKAASGGERAEESEDTIAQRLARLEIGLKALEGFTVPVVIGDFPDMWGADPNLLPPHLIPSPKTLERLNQRLYAWAKSRPQVLVLPLAAWVKEMKEGKTKIPGKEGAVPAEVLLQEDRLHPSPAGAVALTGRIVESIQKWLGKSAEGKLQYDVLKVLEAKGIELEAPAK